MSLFSAISGALADRWAHWSRQILAPEEERSRPPGDGLDQAAADERSVHERWLEEQELTQRVLMSHWF